MIIKNQDIEKIGKFLLNMSLRGRTSLMRTRFIKILQERLDIQNQERQQLINEFAKKDEHGNLIYEKNEQDVEGLVINDPKEFNKEMVNLMIEDFIIEETVDKAEMFLTLKEIILNFDEELSGEDAMIYDTLYELFESVGEPI